MTLTKTIYARVSAENGDWLDIMAQQTRISKAGLLDIILTAARTSGWTVTAGVQPFVVEPGRPSPAAGPGTLAGSGE